MDKQLSKIQINRTNGIPQLTVNPLLIRLDLPYLKFL